jgi:hypothetical protein
MPKNITDVEVFSAVTAPIGTDKRTAASLEVSIQQLANRTRFLRNRHVVTAPDWYIKPSTGSDDAAGTSPATAFATWAGLLAAWGAATLKPTGGVLTVHILEPLPAGTDALYLPPAVNITGDTTVVIRGLPTTVRTGVFTAAAPADRVAVPPLAGTATDSAMPGAWSADLGRRVRVTSGVRANQSFYVAKDLGAQSARISWPIDSHDPSTWVSKGSVQAGDAYAVETLTTVCIGEIASSGSTASGTATYPSIVFIDLHVVPPAGSGSRFTIVDTNCNVAFYGCVIDTEISTSRASNDRGTVFANCCFTNFVTSSSILTIYGGLCLGMEVSSQGTGFLYMDGDVLCQGATIVPGSQAYFGAVGVFDSPAEGVWVNAGTVFYLRSIYDAASGLYGDGNVGAGLYLAERSAFLCTGVVPNIWGTGGQFSMNGSATARAWDEAGGAYTAARACTWANLAATIAGGGFGGNAHNVEKQCSLLVGS